MDKITIIQLISDVKILKEDIDQGLVDTLNTTNSLQMIEDKLIGCLNDIEEQEGVDEIADNNQEFRAEASEVIPAV